MDFELNEEQQQIKRSIREFAEAELRPHVLEWDESQHFPIELLPKFAELGIMGVLFPEEYGGAGMGYIEYATIIEELARVDPSISLSIAAHNSLGAGHIFIGASEQQKQNLRAIAEMATKLRPEQQAELHKILAERYGGGWRPPGQRPPPRPSQ